MAEQGLIPSSCHTAAPLAQSFPAARETTRLSWSQSEKVSKILGPLSSIIAERRGAPKTT
jgi:hypothetical protein